MVKTINKRILIMIIIPFMLVFGIQSVVIVRYVYNNQMMYLRTNTENLAEYNEIALRGYLDSLRVTLMTATRVIEKIRPDDARAREKCEDTVKNMFENPYAFNTWIIFEPQAFDGRDDDFQMQYAGAPSGRFLRSYMRDDSGEILEIFDMDEQEFVGENSAYWYAVPLQTGKLYIDIDRDEDLLYDFGGDIGWQNAVSLVSPVFRGDKVIGCLGIDMLFEKLIVGNDSMPEASSVVFSEKGMVFCSPNNIALGKRLPDLGFRHLNEIEETFRKKLPLFLENEYSPFLDGNGQTLFQPVYFPEFDATLFLYIAFPESLIMEAIRPIMIFIAAVLLVAFFMFVTILIFVSTSISKPIRQIVHAADAISHGNLDTVIPRESQARDEIAQMSRSLYRVVEQFRVYGTMLERSEERIKIYRALMRGLYENDSMRETFDEIAEMLGKHFSAYRVSFVLVTDGKAQRISEYDASEGLWDMRQPMDFVYHAQMAGALKGKRCLYLNTYALSRQKFYHFEEKTQAACVIPFYAEDALEGYIILQSEQEMQPLAHDDSLLAFISEAISKVIMQKRRWQNVQSGEQSVRKAREEGTEILSAAREIGYLHVEDGLALAGRQPQAYEETLRLFARLLPDNIRDLGNSLDADAKLFTVRVHALKSSLYSVGASSLGALAESMEKAAAAGDIAFCRSNYADLEWQLLDLSARLNGLFKGARDHWGTGDRQQLRVALESAAAACAEYDSVRAGEVMEGLLGPDYGDTQINAMTEALADALGVYDCEQAVATIERLRSLLEESE